MWYYFGPWQFRDNAYWMPDGAVSAIDFSPLTGGGFGIFKSNTLITDSNYIRLSSLSGGEPLTAIGMGPARRNYLRTTLNLSEPVEGNNLALSIYNVLSSNSDPDGANGPKPLQVNSRGVLEFFMGGTEPELSARMPRKIWLLPFWSKYQSNIRSAYRQVRELSLGEDTEYKRRLYRRWLEVQRRKYRLTKSLVKQLFIPDDLPQEDPEDPATTITDNFNRGDQIGLGSSSEGWSWSNGGSTWSIVSNAADTAGAGYPGIARANSDLSSSDHYAEVTVAHDSNNQDLMAAARKSGYSTGYGGGYYKAGTAYRFWKFTPTAGNFGSVSSGGSHASRLVRLVVDGSAQSLYIEGALVATGTDTAISAGTRCGLWAWAGADGTFEDFSASDLLPDISVPVFIHHNKNQGIC
jgi:hypothetical protein